MAVVEGEVGENAGARAEYGAYESWVILILRSGGILKGVVV